MMIHVETELSTIAAKLHVLSFLLLERSCGFEMNEKENFGLSCILQECSENLSKISEVCGKVYRQDDSKEKASEMKPASETPEA